MQNFITFRHTSENHCKLKAALTGTSGAKGYVGKSSSFCYLDILELVQTAKSRGLSTGTLIGVIIPVLLVVVVVIAIIIYKCRQFSYSQFGGDRMIDKPARFSDLKSKVQSTFGKLESPYEGTTEPYDEDVNGASA